MQVPVAQPFLWPQMVPPTDQYVTPHNPSHNMVVPQLLGQETLVPVPIVLKNGWLVQGMQQTSSHPATSYLPQPLQYVTVQPRFKMEGGGVEKLITTEQQQQFLTRPILIPRGPATRGNHVTTCGRSLRGNSYATRRQSEENGDGKLSIVENRWHHRLNDFLGTALNWDFFNSLFTFGFFLNRKAASVISSNAEVILVCYTGLYHIQLFYRVALFLTCILSKRIHPLLRLCLVKNKNKKLFAYYNTPN